MSQRPVRARFAGPALLCALALPSPARASPDGEASVPADAARGPELEAPSIEIGGALRYNFFVKTSEAAERGRERGGDFAFDTFRINADGSYQRLEMSAEYRFYAGYSMLHHGYVGYRPSDTISFDVGVSQAPFGLLPFASHNWFFALPYYLGLEDDYDLGARAHVVLGSWDLRLAFYKNDEGSFTGSSLDSARYSYDVVQSSDDELGPAGSGAPLGNYETNQGNLRVVYRLEHPAGYTELGASLEYGGLDNDDTHDMGHHWAGAAHVDVHVGRVNLQLEAARYRYVAKPPPDQRRALVVMGAYDAPYLVAASGYLMVFNAAYRWPVDWGPVEALSLYDDYSALVKLHERWANSYQNVLGVLVEAGPVAVYFDAAMGRNHPWIGDHYLTALAEGRSDAGWEVRYNANVGYYF